MSHHNTAFNLTELLVLVVIITMLLVLVYLFGGTARINTRIMHDMVQMRSIHSGLVIHAQTNNSHYMGVNSDGKTIDPAVGLSTQSRVSQLIIENYISQDYARSSVESQTNTTSFAMLKVDYHDDNTIANTPRSREWRDTSNDKAIILSDRAIRSPSRVNYVSLHNKTYDKPHWYGNVAWNDNHTTTESTLLHATQYDSAAHAADDLFTTGSVNAGDDAFMVWTDTDSL